MLRFAFRNLLTKKVQMILIILSVTVSAGVAVLSYNIANQVSEGITDTAGYYSAIIGPSGSKTQLAMNTMYFTDEPLGTIPYDIGIELQRDSRVKEVIPFAMADSYNGYGVVGTTAAFLSTKTVGEGRLFDDSRSFEVVVGYSVADKCGLEVGSEIHTSHSAGEEHHQSFTVVGILNRTHTVYDNIVFTELSSIWEVHEDEEHEHEAEGEAVTEADAESGAEADAEAGAEAEAEADAEAEAGAVAGAESEDSLTVGEHKNEAVRNTTEAEKETAHRHRQAKADDGKGTDNNTEKNDAGTGEAEQDADHDNCAHENMVCAFLIKTQNPAYAMTLVNEYDGKIWYDDDGCSFSLTAIEPMSTVRAVLEDTNTTKYIVYALCGIILVMNILVVSIITLLNLHHSAQEIELMRLIGISLRKINLLYLIENSLTGIVSGLLAFVLSRIALGAASGLVSDMGVVLNIGKIYPVELIILLAVFIISVVPTVICTSVMAGRSDLQ